VTDQYLELLKASVDEVVTIETNLGERHLAQVLFVFDEGETPDVFYLKVEAASDGSYVPQGSGGHSLLLSEIAAVHPIEP
jgi:hypothetical protein